VPETEKKIRLVIVLISGGRFCSTSVGQVVYRGGRPPCSKTEEDYKICVEKWDSKLTVNIQITNGATILCFR
jgi:hypothetical protein